MIMSSILVIAHSSYLKVVLDKAVKPYEPKEPANSSNVIENELLKLLDHLPKNQMTQYKSSKAKKVEPQTSNLTLKKGKEIKLRPIMA